jgi:octaprenyl-diphosphate synthase
MFSPTLSNRHATHKTSTAVRALIGADLEQVEQILGRALATYRSRFAPLVKHLNHYRGKRLRPTLLLLVARACGKVAAAHHVLAAVVEMIHTATLVHDDVLDEAKLRRHVRTINSGWGNKLSILLGDLLFTNAFHLSSTIGDVRACEWIGEATNRVCAGELLQTSERGNLNLSESDYLEIVEGKTAALTECCGRLGAFYAGADAETVQRLADFGRNLGIAFQIADDVLDIAGNERTAGKTLGTDLKQRKLTLPLIYLLERASSREADRYREMLRRDRIDFYVMLNALRDSGALAAAQLRAEQFAEQARESLIELPSSEFRIALEAIAEWSVRRSA